LQLNVSKTKVILVRGIRKKVSKSNIKIKLDNAVLEVVSEIKYLGVMIGKNLNFTAHVDYLGKKIDSKLGVFRRISVNLTHMRCVVYKAIIAPLFEYYASILLSITNTYKNCKIKEWQLYCDAVIEQKLKICLRR